LRWGNVQPFSRILQLEGLLKMAARIQPLSGQQEYNRSGGILQAPPYPTKNY
jgi:hypothetical protein